MAELPSSDQKACLQPLFCFSSCTVHQALVLVQMVVHAWVIPAIWTVIVLPPSPSSPLPNSSDLGAGVHVCLPDSETPCGTEPTYALCQQDATHEGEIIRGTGPSPCPIPPSRDREPTVCITPKPIQQIVPDSCARQVVPPAVAWR